MKRFSQEHVNQAAREFAASHLARSWHLFGSEIKAAIIDSFVMGQIRWAHVADLTRAFTATEIVEFRDAFAAKLAAGVVPANTRGMRCAFKVEE
jgi:hypothetical protein